MVERLAFRVAALEAGQRIDKLLVQRVPRLGRRRASALCDAGNVRVGGVRVKKSYVTSAGDEIAVELEPQATRDPDLPLDVRLEAEHYVIVAKPAGVPSAALQPGERGTISGALLARYPEMQSVGYREREPGLLHRLDTGTSGLLLAARTELGFETLRSALRAGEIEKHYLAIVEGAWLDDAGRIDLPLGPEHRGSARVSAVSPLALPRAPSLYRVLQRRERWALVEVAVTHAYRHQVRAHLAATGHPIAGDTLYGGAPLPELAGRHALHACKLAWAGTDRIGGFCETDGLPEDLARVLSG